MTLFEAYVTNAGKYADYGVQAGESLKFPTTTEEVQALLKRIGVDGVRYQEIFIVSFDGDVLGLYDYLNEYENLDELNHLAHLLSELDQGELETLEAVLNKGDHTSSVADIINLVHNLDCYDLHPGVSDDETLGRIYVEDMERLEVPEDIINYFPQFTYGEPYSKVHARKGSSPNYGKFERQGSASNDGRRYPGNVLFVQTVAHPTHPTQKPVELCEYLIKTYTRPGEVVADLCAGSGTTAVATLNTGRRFVCFESAPAIYGPAAQRIEQARLAVARGEKGE